MAVPFVSPTKSRAQSALLQRTDTALASASDALPAPVTPSQLPSSAADDSVKKRKRDKPKKKKTADPEAEQKKQPEKAKKRKVVKSDGSKQTSGTGNAGEAAELRARLGVASPAATLATPPPAPFSFGFGFQSPAAALASTPPPAALFQAHAHAAT